MFVVVKIDYRIYIIYTTCNTTWGGIYILFRYKYLGTLVLYMGINGCIWICIFILYIGYTTCIGITQLAQKMQTPTMTACWKSRSCSSRRLPRQQAQKGLSKAGSS